MDSICKKVGRKIGALRHTYRQLTPTARRQFFVSVIQPDLEYAASATIPFMPTGQQDKLLALWKKAVRCLAGVHPQDDVLPLIRNLKLTLLSHRWSLQLYTTIRRCSAPAKKLKVNLTLPLEVDQTTTLYSWREPSTIVILFCCQAWIGTDYEKRALFFFMSSRDRVAMATLVIDLRIHPFVVPTTIFLDVTHRGLVLTLWHVWESEDIAVLGSIWWPSPTDFKVAAT